MEQSEQHSTDAVSDEPRTPRDRRLIPKQESLCYLVALTVICWGYFAVWDHRGKCTPDEAERCTKVTVICTEVTTQTQHCISGLYTSVQIDFAFAIVFSVVAAIFVVMARKEALLDRPCDRWFRTLWNSGFYLALVFTFGVGVATFKAWQEKQTVGSFEVGGAALLGAFIVGIVFEGTSRDSKQTEEQKTAWKVGVSYLLVSALVATFGLAQGNGSYHTFALMSLFGSLLSAALLILLRTRRRESNVNSGANGHPHISCPELTSLE